MENRPTSKQTFWAMRRAFFYGMFFYMGFNMLLQDYLGLEGYITFVRTHWTELHWGIGLLIAAFGLFLHVGLLGRFHWLNTCVFKYMEKERENEKR